MFTVTCTKENRDDQKINKLADVKIAIDEHEESVAGEETGQGQMSRQRTVKGHHIDRVKKHGEQR